MDRFAENTTDLGNQRVNVFMMRSTLARDSHQQVDEAEIQLWQKETNIVQ